MTASETMKRVLLHVSLFSSRRRDSVDTSSR